MARRGPNSPDIGEQPVLHHVRAQPELDDNYTVVGRVVSGMDAVDGIAPGEPPESPTKIVSAYLAMRAGSSRWRDASGAMRVDLFDFELPPDRIALRPARPRDSARLLLVERRRDLRPSGARPAALLRPGDVLVFNDTKVIPAQLEGRRGDASIGATLHKREGPREWQAFLRNAKRARVGDTIDFGEGVSASVVEKADDGSALLHFDGDEPVELLLERAGRMPLPPYIASKRAADDEDRADYQTMFAREEGAVAAPTAALHFTPRLLDALDARGIGRETLTLHVGAGTFLPVKAEDTSGHRMHAEWGRIDAATAERLNAMRAAGGRLIAVGTTSLRLLESAAGRGRDHPARSKATPRSSSRPAIASRRSTG